MAKLKKFFQENFLSLFALLVMGGIVFLALNQNKAPQPPSPSVTPTPGATSPQPEPATTDWPFLGNPEAKVVFVEYGDYQCGFCRRFNQEVLPELKQRYLETGKVKFVYKDFVIFGETSKLAAQAAHCAGDQNKFFEYHNEIFKNQEKGLSLETLLAIATNLGLNRQEFESCLSNGKYAEKVEQSTQEGLSLGVEGTPTSFINGQKIVGARPFSSFETIIESLLGNN